MAFGRVSSIFIKGVTDGMDSMVSVLEISINHGLISGAHYHYSAMSLSHNHVVGKDRTAMPKALSTAIARFATTICY